MQERHEGGLDIVEKMMSCDVDDDVDCGKRLSLGADRLPQPSLPGSALTLPFTCACTCSTCTCTCHMHMYMLRRPF